MAGVAGKVSRIVATLVLDGLRRTVPEALEDQKAVAAVMGAGDEGVPLAPYRAILRAAYAHDGGKALLGAGETLRELQHPLLFVLLNSDSPTLLIEKEMRLSAFFHSRHQVLIEEANDTNIVLRHASTIDEPTQAVDNLASCAQHLVLLEEIGCHDLRLRFPDSTEPERWVYERRTLSTPPAGGGYDRWHFAWSKLVPSRRPMEGLDEMLLGGTREPELAEEEDAIASVRRIIRRDLGRTWKIGDVAAALDVSTRSLQRSLAALGDRYSDVVDRTRNLEAARLLRQSELSITEIGYICGFADSAHFSRSFKKRHGVSPSAFRAEGQHD